MVTKYPKPISEPPLKPPVVLIDKTLSTLEPGSDFTWGDIVYVFNGWTDNGEASITRLRDNKRLAIEPTTVVKIQTKTQEGGE